jgi:hexosaminidase
MERHYRRKQHKILTQLNPKKKFMYWMNFNDIKIEEDDIVHWWGSTLPPTNRQIVISQYGPFYLDMGVGNYLGVSYGSYQTWMDLYNQDIGRLIENYENKKNVIGAEVCLWSELSNQYVHHSKIWIRSSAFAERVWTFK